MLRKTVEGYPYEQFIYCYCGCKKTRPKYGSNGILRYFIRGHNTNVNNPNSNNGISHDREYKQIYKPNHPYKTKRGYILEHRLVAEEFLSNKLGLIIYLDKSVLVHHINENKQDNSVKNLSITTRSIHPSNHRTDYGNTLCSICTRMTFINKSGRRKGRPEWFLNPYDRTKYICVYCYHKIKGK